MLGHIMASQRFDSMGGGLPGLGGRAWENAELLCPNCGYVLCHTRGVSNIDRVASEIPDGQHESREETGRGHPMGPGQGDHRAVDSDGDTTMTGVGTDSSHQDMPNAELRCPNCGYVLCHTRGVNHIDRVVSEIPDGQHESREETGREHPMGPGQGDHRAVDSDGDTTMTGVGTDSSHQDMLDAGPDGNDPDPMDCGPG